MRANLLQLAKMIITNAFKPAYYGCSYEFTHVAWVIKRKMQLLTKNKYKRIIN